MTLIFMTDSSYLRNTCKNKVIMMLYFLEVVQHEWFFVMLFTLNCFHDFDFYDWLVTFVIYNSSYLDWRLLDGWWYYKRRDNEVSRQENIKMMGLIIIVKQKEMRTVLITKVKENNFSC